MMAIGTDVAVVCGEAVPDEKQRKHLLERLNRHHKVCAPLHVHPPKRTPHGAFCNITDSLCILQDQLICEMVCMRSQYEQIQVGETGCR